MKTIEETTAEILRELRQHSNEGQKELSWEEGNKAGTDN